MRILLAEDDPQLGDGLTVGLRQTGLTVDWVRDGQAADLALQAETFQLMVLDLGLPILSGMTVLQRARQRAQTLPIILLTARDATGDKVAGLDAGADDYLVKPVDLDELAARIRALARRHAGRAAPLLIVKDLTLDPAARQVFSGWRTRRPVQPGVCAVANVAGKRGAGSHPPATSGLPLQLG